MKQSESIINISKALVEAQKETGSAVKGSTNPFFHSKYADLGAVMEACKEPFNKVGITILQPIIEANVETILIHTSGEWIASETPIICKDASDPQKFGSAISYARRYGLQSMVFIPAEDDDGEIAKKPIAPSPAPVVKKEVPLDETDPIDKAIAGFKGCPACKAPLTASGKIFHKPGCPRKVEGV